MHIIYIEFGISKSTQYKKVCNLAKQLPNYACSEGITQGIYPSRSASNVQRM